MYSISNRDNAGGAVSLLAEWVQTPKTYSAFICRLPRQQIPYTSLGDLIYLLAREQRRCTVLAGWPSGLRQLT